EGLAQVERARAIGADLATTEDEARHEAQDVEPPRADESVVEIVEVEDDFFLLARLDRLAERQRAGAVGPEVFEVGVSDEPPFPGRPLRQRRVTLEQLVEERRRTPQERERRRDHALGLVRE